MKAREDYCPESKERIHSYHDLSYWNDENHPACLRCGYIDKTRELDAVTMDQAPEEQGRERII